MKCLVVSDLHGSIYHYKLINELFSYEKADEIVILGDFATSYGIPEECLSELRKLPVKPIAINGNCDYGSCDVPETDFQGDFYLTKRFSRHFFFTHGDRYNIANIPTVLEKGDVLCYGHFHEGGLFIRNGIYIALCGSLSLPRHGSLPSYLIIDKTGITLKSSENHEILDKIEFLRQNELGKCFT